MAFASGWKSAVKTSQRFWSLIICLQHAEKIAVSVISRSRRDYRSQAYTVELWLVFCVERRAIKMSDCMQRLFSSFRCLRNARQGKSCAERNMKLSFSSPIKSPRVWNYLLYNLRQNLHMNCCAGARKSIGEQIETLAFLIDSSQLWTIIFAPFSHIHTYCTTFYLFRFNLLWKQFSASVINNIVSSFATNVEPHSVPSCESCPKRKGKLYLFIFYFNFDIKRNEKYKLIHKAWQAEMKWGNYEQNTKRV